MKKLFSSALLALALAFFCASDILAQDSEELRFAITARIGSQVHLCFNRDISREEAKMIKTALKGSINFRIVSIKPNGTVVISQRLRWEVPLGDDVVSAYAEKIAGAIAPGVKIAQIDKLDCCK